MKSDQSNEIKLTFVVPKLLTFATSQKEDQIRNRVKYLSIIQCFHIYFKRKLTHINGNILLMSLAMDQSNQCIVALNIS